MPKSTWNPAATTAAPMPKASTTTRLMKKIWKPRSDISEKGGSVQANGIVKGEAGQDEKADDEENRQEQEAVNGPLFRQQVHEHGGHATRLDRRQDHRDDNVRLL